MGDLKIERHLAETKFLIMLRRNKFIFSNRMKQWYEIRHLSSINNKHCILSRGLWISATNIKYTGKSDDVAYMIGINDWMIGGSGAYINNYIAGEFIFSNELTPAMKMLYVAKV